MLVVLYPGNTSNDPSELAEKPPEVPDVPMIKAVPGLPTVPLILIFWTGAPWFSVLELISTIENVVAEAAPLSGDKMARSPGVNGGLDVLAVVTGPKAVRVLTPFCACTWKL